MHGNIRLNFRPTRKELVMANTMTMPKRGASEDVLPPITKKESVERFRMQVDRLTKASFKTKDEAEKAGGVIKKSYPKVHVASYDAKKCETTVL
jgi:hypothetical protein